MVVASRTEVFGLAKECDHVDDFVGVLRFQFGHFGVCSLGYVPVYVMPVVARARVAVRGMCLRIRARESGDLVCEGRE